MPGMILGGAGVPPPQCSFTSWSFLVKTSNFPTELVKIGPKNMFQLNIFNKNWYNLSHIVLFCLNWSYFDLFSQILSISVLFCPYYILFMFFF